MSPHTQPESSSAISPETRSRLHQLAHTLLERYQIDRPPVPISQMINRPLDDLWQTNPGQVSFVIGHGIYRYAPRLAEARMLYRLISDNVDARRVGLDAPWPASRREIKYFARCLLMPEDWIRALPEADRTPDAISAAFQVTSFDALIRLAELGLPVPDGSKTESD
ncbi:MAG TPA: hypothetical protein VFF59_04570 [Anaerolineae bacterium]|nr:hypothetical protein [Anaerolineae bacterium]